MGNRVVQSCAFFSVAIISNVYANLAYISTPEIIEHEGYPIEIHPLVVSDNYILQHHRIPHGKNPRSRDPRLPVIVQHGLVGDSSNFVLNYPGTHSLGFVLADAGFDVWIINCRGNIYSRNHTIINPNMPRFWDFSWHEIGIIDLPETINYILNVTGALRVAHVGHSQGTTAMWVLLSQKPEFASKIAMHISLSPIAFHEHTINPIFKFIQPFEKWGIMAMQIMRRIEFGHRNALINQILVNGCSNALPTRFICEETYYTLFGNNPSELNKTRLNIIYGHFPSPSSMKQFTHYVQSMNSRKFAQFDYKEVGNLGVYGQLEPPEYNLKNVSIPVHIFYGGRDSFAQLPDVFHLLNELPNVVETIFIDKWSHYDFLYGINAYIKVYKLVVQMLGKYQ